VNVPKDMELSDVSGPALREEEGIPSESPQRLGDTSDEYQR
jgi:hypothetical protein